MINLDNISEIERNSIIEMIATDEGNIHFLYNCKENKTINLCGNVFPDNIGNPFEYMKTNNMIDETSVPLFDVFYNRIKDGITNGIDTNSIGIDVPLKFGESESFLLYHVYALFLCDENKKITFIHVNMRPFTTKEIFNKDVVSFFTSDKNPKYFTQRVKQMMDRNADRNIAFVQFDIERFKLINDNYGVETGDALLKFFSESLALICTDDQPFCRLSADLFMMIICFDKESEILDFIHMLEDKLSGYMGMEYRFVFGVAIAEDRTLHTRRHGDNATLARQTVKGNALNNIGFYNGSLKNKLYKQQNIEDDMTKALNNNEFVMFLQPKHCISTGRIIGAEALARWIHHEKGMISPADFIPVFEKNGFILKLDQFMWERAAIKIREWLDKKIEPVPISVNISREYIKSFDIVAKLSELVKKYEIPVDLLQLEITESAESGSTVEVVKKLKEVGFTMLMDDFGTGYSSLNMLKTTPFDVLKIDKSFLSEFMESDRGRKIISHTISMSNDIGLDIIAEGVENIEQAKFLKECGCDSAQGFYYSKPITESEFDKRLAEINK